MDKLEEILESVNGWVRFAEAKNLALSTICGAGMWATLRLIHLPEVSASLKWYLLELLLFLALSLTTALISFVPTTRYYLVGPIGDPKGKTNLVFFGHLAYQRKKQLVDAFVSAVGATEKDVSEYHRMVAEQVIINSRIALAKYQFFTWGLYLLLLGFLTPVLGLPAIYIAGKRVRAVDGY